MNIFEQSTNDYAKRCRLVQVYKVEHVNQVLLWLSDMTTV